MTNSTDRPERDEFLLDRIDALRVVRADTPEERSRLLEEIGGRGQPEQDIVSELSKVRPLWRPDRFEEAHRMVMRSLEVLDRNGWRPAALPHLGPLTPVAQWAVQLVNEESSRPVDRISRLITRRLPDPAVAVVR